MSGDVGVDKKDVSRKAAEHGLILSSVALDRILELGLDYDDILKDAKEAGEWFISPEYIDSLIVEDKERTCEPSASEDRVEVVKTRKPAACDIESRLKIREDSDVTGKSTCSAQLEDFTAYFNTRYENIRGVIQERVEYKTPLTLEDLRSKKAGDRGRIICIVNERRESSKGYKFLEVEDQTGEATVLISGNDERLAAAYERILPDEVIGVEGVLKGDLFIASDITQPDIPLNHPRRYADEEVYAAFISDIHVGSYLFLEREFQSFIDWLNGRGNRRDVSEKVKYLFVAGDLVDGIGIYPEQEKELTIPDISKQYEFLGILLEEVPDHIEVVLGMGNHDAVRNAEPQPMVGREVAESLHELPNVRVTGNPVRFQAHGVEFLMYHGTSLDTIIGNLSGCTYSRPETAMIEYLKRRHLVPTYGKDSISPENKDYLFIGDVPDVFHCGHVHTNGYSLYRGVNVINSGTWQAKTEYQERLGHQPTPALVPVMNLQNHEVSMLDFSGNGRKR
ncbi:MAG: DNA-directed DNA polymerase II small subunit [Candidatus Altiarchaeales archaeon]|nr:DNA-directed DNA polymerase II small subunit [Candidatus Altiarchaeales archaeon]MBD3416276.1 DNA-directed DNA polymerase II small subunit [Candidatus Altiarchaeales archaeon]